MKTGIISIFILFGAFLLSQSTKEKVLSSQENIPESDKIALNLIDQTGKSLSAKYGLHPCGFGIDNGFEYLEISFEVFRVLTREEARSMLIDCTQTFINNINSDEKIRPHLKYYPVTFQNAGIEFYIRDKNNKDIFHPNVCVATCSASGVYFYTTDPVTDRFKEKSVETHEKALELVKKFQAGIFKNERSQNY